MSRCPFLGLDRDCARREREPQPHIVREPLYGRGGRICAKCKKRRRSVKR